MAGDEERSGHHRERGQGDNSNHQKRKHEDKDKDKEKKKKSEVESISSLKKLNEELKEKVKKQGRAADKMAEEYSKLRGRLRKYKREREGLEAEIETLKQRNKDLAKMVGNFGNGDLLKDCQAGSVKTEKAGENESNSTTSDPHHKQSLMAEVQKLKVQNLLLDFPYFSFMIFAGFNEECVWRCCGQWCSQQNSYRPSIKEISCPQRRC